jgi:hypothetical protein
VKLVLDEHYTPKAAEQLRERGYGVVAVGEQGQLRALEDEDLLRWAQREGRILVTENVGDFMVIHNAFLGRGELHGGILFTSPRKFPRRMAAIEHLVDVLTAFIEEETAADALQGGVAWL